MVKVNGVELSGILKLHKMWLYNEGGGSRADLSRADLSRADLSRADLSRADLSCANLRGANLSGADLSGANLSGANLSGANLSRANLSGADLRGADLSDADLSGANLSGANLRSADLRDVKYNERTSFFALQCPEEGSFIAYKKCAHNTIVKLRIPENAKRSSATSRKCRAEFAEVLEIQNIDGTIYGTEVRSQRDKTLYKVGEMVYPDKYDDDRWNECSNGIHFFITRQEAVQY